VAVAGFRTAGNSDYGFPKQSIVKPILKMEAVCYFTTCLHYHITRSHKTEDRNARINLIETYFTTVLINSLPKQTHKYFFRSLHLPWHSVIDQQNLLTSGVYLNYTVDRISTYNVTLRHFSVTTIAVEMR